ncbi:MAG: hypothetical protein HC858_12420 [Brachymonas sp.]|nr:hypothetical protein [Brachymonas sp.]
MKYALSALEFIASGKTVEALWQLLRGSKTLAEWLRSLYQVLHEGGLWSGLRGDAAGQQVLAALMLDRVMEGELALHDIVSQDASPMSAAQFNQWVQEALEGAIFKVGSPLAQGETADVVILPLAQMAARPFACAVLAGTDEQRLPLAPPLSGTWTRAQRVALGLPLHEQVMQEQQTAWAHAMQVSQVHVIWRKAQGDEPLSPSPLLQAWMLSHARQQGVDARVRVRRAAQPQSRPAPSAAALANNRWSASSYADVRTCPYRYFALRLLGLQEALELDEELSKREFGAWLHEVLSEFHRARPVNSDAQRDVELLDASAAKLSEPLLQDAGFVPFAASWPQLRDSYLKWLSEHEGKGWRFEASEINACRELALHSDEESIRLQGRLDRLDVLHGAGDAGAPHVAVMDYKTEAEGQLKKRVARPLEDTQLVFYAALLSVDEGQAPFDAAYIALGEKTTRTVSQPQVQEALPLLLKGLTDDAQRIGAGHSLPALGEGRSCELCAARGLCRKDSWSAA